MISLEKSLFVTIADTVLIRKTKEMIKMFKTVNEVLFVVMFGSNKYITLKRSALIERLLPPIRRDSFVINPPRLSVNSKRSLRFPSKKKKEPKKIKEKYTATLMDSSIFLSFNKNTPKKSG